MKKLLIALCVFGILATVRADLLVAYNTSGNSGLETNEPASAVHADLSATDMTAVGITPAGNTNRFGGSSWSTLSAPVITNDYLTFTLSANSGFMYTVTNVIFIFDRSPTGPSNVVLRTSLDSFASDVVSALGLPAAIAGRTNAVSGLTDVTTLEFRLYGYGATSAAGVGGLDQASGPPGVNNFILNGTVSVIPEPSSVALFGMALSVVCLIRRRNRSI